MRNVLSGGLVAAALGAAVLVAGPAPATAQNWKEGKGQISSGGRVSSGATIRGNSVRGPRQSMQMSSGPNRQRWAGNHNNWNNNWRHRHRGSGVSIGLGFGAPYYYGAPYYAYEPGYYAAAPADDAVAYCMERFQSYNPATGTYLGYDGLQHPCP